MDKSIKPLLTAALTALTAFVGWKGILAVCWILAMAMDYISGTAAACREKNWSSRLAREGLWHKCGMIFAVAVAGVTDLIMAVLLGNIPQLRMQWPGLLLPLVLAWYILTELGSVLENAVKLGAPVPKWLQKVLRSGREAVDRGGGET